LREFEALCRRAVALQALAPKSAWELRRRRKVIFDVARRQSRHCGGIRDD